MHVNEPLLAFSKKCVTDNCILVYLSYKEIFFDKYFYKASCVSCYKAKTSHLTKN